MASYRRIDDGLDLRLIKDSKLEIIEQNKERLTARWNVWDGALNSIGTCQGMIHFGMADVIAAIVCDREGIVVTKDASCFYHKPLYEGDVEVEAFIGKNGKTNITVEVLFYQKGALCFQSIFTMHATRKTYNE
ncbi:thioesterase family protein [Aedoeadaptatus coxii]|uniref:Thioesterase family protein n=1 Tax=Aedoeadaptatus coxii TaxID=755172 RepID=A0A134AKL6_9FIRM|nr:PaaI family thioesterase [Peptoniphilus coxii]KXB68273.1 thioesterase family protein [Peptoniphilus coxii]